MSQKKKKTEQGQGAAQRPVSRKRSRNRSRRHVGGAGEGGPNSPMICDSTMFTETCRVKRCDLENIDVQIGDPYRILP